MASVIRITYLISLLIGVIIACCALGLNASTRVTNRSNNANVVLAFSALALIFLIASAIVTILLFTGLEDSARLLLIVSLVLDLLAVISFAIASGVSYYNDVAVNAINLGPPFCQEWLLSGAWVSLVCALFALGLMFSDSD